MNQIKPASLSGPGKPVIDYSQSPFALYVSDTGNNRVLVWKDAARFQNAEPADLVIGQPDLSTGYPNVDTGVSQKPSATSLYSPHGLALDAGGRLYVADTGNNRVLSYPRPVAQTGRITPDRVLGQTDFDSGAVTGVDGGSLDAPWAVAVVPDGTLLVADAGNNRVLQFSAGSAFKMAAARVFGQPDFTSRGASSSVSAATLSSPRGVWVDPWYHLYIADSGSNRVLIYPDIRSAASSGPAASIVLGQTQFKSSSSGTGAQSLRSPEDVATDSVGQIYVSDSGNHRILVFPALVSLPSTGAAATGVNGQNNLSSNAPNWDSTSALATADGLNTPLGILVDRKDTVYAADSGNNRVVQYLKAANLLSAADFQAGAPVAGGSLVSLFGDSLADTVQINGQTTWPTNLADREVVVNASLLAPLDYVASGQINFQLPAAAPAGTARIAVRMFDTAELLASGTTSVVNSEPAFFTSDGTQAVVLNQDNTENSPKNPAPRGSTVQFFGTGQGPVSPAVADGSPGPSGTLARTTAVPTSDGATCLQGGTVCLAIASAFADIHYSGLAPGLVGVWQLNATIPQATTPGSAVPVRAVVNGSPTNLVTIAVK